MKLLRRLLKPWRDPAHDANHIVIKEKLAAHEEVADSFEVRLRHLERERQLYRRRQGR